MQSRRKFVKRLGIAALASAAIMTTSPSAVWAATAEAPEVMVYRSEGCGCCLKWADHLRENGFTVTVENRDDMGAIKAQQGVPQDLQSCHTATVAGYTIEGHVPAPDILRLLEEKSDARGLAVPGMPVGSPGMEHGSMKQPYEVVLFGEAGRSVFARH